VTISWRRVSLTNEQRTPVEMRFIDMFMTALGSLLFLAVLLSFLIIHLPRSGQTITAPRPMPIAKLRILTKTLPDARVGEPYYFALAYRGGTGPISWKISLNEAPLGISFDPEQGVFSGVPSEVDTKRFVVEARDARGPAEPRDYSIRVTSAPVTAQTVSMWIAVLLSITLVLCSFMAVAISINENQTAQMARDAHRRGQGTLTINRTLYKSETIILPDGINELLRTARTSLKIARFTFLAAVAVAGYIIWIIWG
jgi:hypothetical protein